ncbi:MAG: RagB/SusD family nutrient uptake outer membrane protein [Muricauda sp.]|nr:MULTISPECIES: RagB/SusD family nutrient uptake outer membrane protein [unclassified Allomuricauda]MAU15162.1 RagB/SusD family nutrient uptake outer membrane protein [Allomuricauda sp.]
MKTKIFKSIFTLIWGILFFSCSLEETPVSEPTPDAIYSTSSGIRDGVNGIYSYLRSLYGSQVGFTMTTMGTDIFRHGKDGGYKAMDRYGTDFNSSLGYVEDIWEICYRGINSANTILERIDLVEMPDSDKTGLKAEARFLRAHFYYWLTIQYGDVVLRDSETKGVITDDVRTDKTLVWEFMREDTEYAVENLDWGNSDYGRATKGAALHQLAEILLLLEDYSGAEQAGKQLIAEGPYSLLDSYGDIFEYDNQKNEEIVFAVQYINDPLNNGSGNQGHLFFTPAYDQFPGLTRDLTQGGRPWTRFRPTQFYRELFEDNDTRFDVTFRYTWTYNNEETLPEGAQVGDTVVWETTPGVFSFIAPNTDQMHWGIKKHDDPTRASFQDTRGFRDFFVYRLSETYLIVAEALMRQDKLQEAADYINVVRNRAAETGTALVQVNANEVDIDFILDERARELGGESQRWMDLARTGKLQERVSKYNENAAPNIKDFHMLRPIPQSQIDLSTNGFPQNKGY